MGGRKSTEWSVYKSTYNRQALPYKNATLLRARDGRPCRPPQQGARGGCTMEGMRVMVFNACGLSHEHSDGFRN